MSNYTILYAQWSLLPSPFGLNQLCQTLLKLHDLLESDKNLRIHNERSVDSGIVTYIFSSWARKFVQWALPSLHKYYHCYHYH